MPGQAGTLPSADPLRVGTGAERGRCSPPRPPGLPSRPRYSPPTRESQLTGGRCWRWHRHQHSGTRTAPRPGRKHGAPGPPAAAGSFRTPPRRHRRAALACGQRIWGTGRGGGGSTARDNTAPALPVRRGPTLPDGPLRPAAPVPPRCPPERRRRARPGRPRPVSRVPRGRATAGLEAAPLRDGRRPQPTAASDVTASPLAGDVMGGGGEPERGRSADRPLSAASARSCPRPGPGPGPAPALPLAGPRLGPAQRQQRAHVAAPTCPAGAGADSAPHRGTAAARSPRRRWLLAESAARPVPPGRSRPGGTAGVTQRFVGAGDVTERSLPDWQAQVPARSRGRLAPLWHRCGTGSRELQSVQRTGTMP